jgi:hypothetical protein
MQAERKFEGLIHFQYHFRGERGQYANKAFFSDGLNLVQVNHALLAAVIL